MVDAGPYDFEQQERLLAFYETTLSVAIVYMILCIKQYVMYVKHGMELQSETRQGSAASWTRMYNEWRRSPVTFCGTTARVANKLEYNMEENRNWTCTKI